MTESAGDVVVVGGGITGLTAAYYLAKSGVSSVVVERDAIGSHASGFAYGGLSPLGTAEEEAGVDEESTPVARDESGVALLRMLPEWARATSGPDAQVGSERQRLAIPVLRGLDVGRAPPGAYRWFEKKPCKDFRYLTKTYLPRKLREEGWLD